MSVLCIVTALCVPDARYEDYKSTDDCCIQLLQLTVTLALMLIIHTVQIITACLSACLSVFCRHVSI